MPHLFVAAVDDFATVFDHYLPLLLKKPADDPVNEDAANLLLIDSQFMKQKSEQVKNMKSSKMGHQEDDYKKSISSSKDGGKNNDYDKDRCNWSRHFVSKQKKRSKINKRLQGVVVAVECVIRGFYGFQYHPEAM
nr:hypothetical protein [Tanacetum cinerariifolium]